MLGREMSCQCWQRSGLPLTVKILAISGVYPHGSACTRDRALHQSGAAANLSGHLMKIYCGAQFLCVDQAYVGRATVAHIALSLGFVIAHRLEHGAPLV